MWFANVSLLSPRAYWLRVGLLALMSFAYWESMNDILFHRWAIDGYPSFVAAKLWLQGHSEAIYQSQLWVPDGGHPLWKRTMALNGIPNAGTAFVYHPIYLLLVAPFAASLTVDQFVWLLLAVNAISAGVLALELVRLSENGAGDRNLLAVSAVCASFPVLYGVFLGQNVLPTLVLLIVGWRYLGEQRTLRGSAMLVLAIALKAWVAPVAFLALGIHGWKKVVGGAAMSMIGLLAIPYVLDAELLAAYFEIASRLTNITVYPFNNVSVTAWLLRLLNPDWGERAFIWSATTVSVSIRYGAMLFFAGALLAGLWCYRMSRVSDSGVFVASLALLLLLPSVCWSHYLVFLLPSAVFLWLKGEGWRVGFGLGSMLFLLLPWHSVPGSFVLRETMRDWIHAWPGVMTWSLLLPMLLSLALGLAVLSSGEKSRSATAK